MTMHHADTVHDMSTPRTAEDRLTAHWRGARARPAGGATCSMMWWGLGAMGGGTGLGMWRRAGAAWRLAPPRGTMGCPWGIMGACVPSNRACAKARMSGSCMAKPPGKPGSRPSMGMPASECTAACQCGLWLLMLHWWRTARYMLPYNGARKPACMDTQRCAGLGKWWMRTMHPASARQAAWRRSCLMVLQRWRVAWYMLQCACGLQVNTGRSDLHEVLQLVNMQPGHTCCSCSVKQGVPGPVSRICLGRPG